jgi:hypothetical protein
VLVDDVARLDRLTLGADGVTFLRHTRKSLS